MEQTKKIIIPNDFSVKPLMLVKRLLETTNDHYDIIFLNGVNLPGGYADMLFFRKNKYIAELKTTEFNQAYKMLKNKYAHRLNSMKLDCITSTNKSYINSYLEVNEVDEAYTFGDLLLDYSHKRSFDISPALNKSNTTVSAVNLLEQSEAASYFTNDAADLFIPSIVG